LVIVVIVAHNTAREKEREEEKETREMRRLFPHYFHYFAKGLTRQSAQQIEKTAKENENENENEKEIEKEKEGKDREATYMLLVDGLGDLVEEGLDLGIQLGLQVSCDGDTHGKMWMCLDRREES